MLKKFLGVTGIALSLGLCSNVLAADNVTVGFVDGDKVISESPQFKQYQADLNAKFGDKNKKLVEEDKAIQEKEKKFQKNSSVMRAKAKELEEKKLNEEKNKLLSRFTEFQKEATEYQNTHMKNILDDFKLALRTVADAKKIDLVVGAQAVLHFNADKNLNLTEAVAKKMVELSNLAATSNKSNK